MRSMDALPRGPHPGPEVNLLYCTSVQDVRCAARMRRRMVLIRAPKLKLLDRTSAG